MRWPLGRGRSRSSSVNRSLPPNACTIHRTSGKARRSGCIVGFSAVCTASTPPAPFEPKNLPTTPPNRKGNSFRLKGSQVPIPRSSTRPSQRGAFVHVQKGGSESSGCKGRRPGASCLPRCHLSLILRGLLPLERRSFKHAPPPRWWTSALAESILPRRNEGGGGGQPSYFPNPKLVDFYLSSGA